MSIHNLPWSYSVQTNKLCFLFYIQGLKKPYNPIIGESFRCYWLHPNGTKTYFVSEQISHHPPVSAYYVSNRQEGYVVNCSCLAKSKFYGKLCVFPLVIFSHTMLTAVFSVHITWRVKVKAHTSQRPRRPELIPVSVAWSMPWSIATRPGRDASPSQGYPPAVCRRYPFTHMGEERQSGVKFLV